MLETGSSKPVRPQFASSRVYETGIAKEITGFDESRLLPMSLDEI
jgi:hypothetical protein